MLAFLLVQLGVSSSVAKLGGVRLGPIAWYDDVILPARPARKQNQTPNPPRGWKKGLSAVPRGSLASTVGYHFSPSCPLQVGRQLNSKNNRLTRSPNFSTARCLPDAPSLGLMASLAQTLPVDPPSWEGQLLKLRPRFARV